MAEQSPQVFLVGAGPGHPGLLTLRAVECLAQADLVVYDRLVPPRLLNHAPADAERLCVADLPGGHAERYPHVQNVLIEAARAGKRVVRLKGGDPFLFGRGGEEAEALRQAGIAFEVVPGVTAALAAGAFAGIPLTQRFHASAVALVTGHEDPAKPENGVDWAALARFPGTLAIYMGITRLGPIVQALLENGKAPDTPAAVIRWAATGAQETVESSLADLPKKVAEEGLKPPAVVIVGPVVQLRAQLAWFEQRPLFGKHVLITRPRAQAAELAARLEQEGAVTHIEPVIDIREPADWGPVERALQNLERFNWVVFTSSNGVQAFLGRLKQVGLDLRSLGKIKLAAIGPGTAEALRAFHLKPDLVPLEYRSESLALALKEPARGQRVLLVRADRGREVLREELEAVADVEQIAVYAQVELDLQTSAVIDELRQGKIDYVTLTSSNIARALLRALDAESRAQILSGRVRLVSISPVTSAAIEEMGLPVAAEATVYTTTGVVDALIGLAKKDNA
jgi:uroporphyrinogen III methyltransferase / synthase